ncbi:multidrug resistance-associated protein 4-like [Asterias rubens]|uniref:multidrug resistance-associated protein 4-like n=1 Tax=Asterias rubens TaxID=7604 RepID=UPI0014555CD5|nr:multidrug resistance-associated protein 4-like [Asterias rubens]
MSQKESIEAIRKGSAPLPQHESDDDEGTDTPTESMGEDTGLDMADDTTVCGDAEEFSKRVKQIDDGVKPGVIDHVQQRIENPLKRAGVFSKLFFCWMFSFFKKGYRKPIEEEDLYEVLAEDSSKILAEKLEREWDKELIKSTKTGKPPSLTQALLKTFGWSFMWYGLPAFFEEVVFKIAQPVLLSRLVLYFSTDIISPLEAYLCAAGISLSAFGILMCHHIAFFGFGRVGMRVRVACSSLIYRKSLRLSHLALGETTIGQLVNILSNDVNRFDLAFNFLHYLWIGPIQLAVVTVLMWWQIGPSCLAGLSILLLLSPLQAYMGKLFSKFRAKTALLSDSRIRIMNEIISGIRVIKIYAWEKSFGSLVSEARRKEIRKIMHTSYLRAFTLGFFFMAPLLMVFSTFVMYAILGNPVVSAKVYAVLPLFYAARLCTALFLPYAIMNGTEGLVSIRRIKKFLLMDEIVTQPRVTENGQALPEVEFKNSPVRLDDLQVTADENKTSALNHVEADARDPTKSVSDETVESPLPSTAFLTHNSPIPTEKEEQFFTYEMQKPRPDACGNHLVAGGSSTVVVDNLNGSWTKDVDGGTLENVSFSVEPGELLAVIGPVGCGKSSLLMALLGELPSISGVVSLQGKVGYTAQQPWILSGSLKDNILFGSPYEPVRYHRIIRQCALRRDIELLPHGDQTLVGERGVTLSGGQRARVSLARAVYSDADVYLLDDPLSAVDPAVGRHLFEKCILKFLKTKPRILVTHQLQFLDLADKILILDQGKVAGYGTYQDLQEHGVDFASLLKKKSLEGDYDGEGEELRSLQRQMSTTSKSSLCSSVGHYEVEEPVAIVPEEVALGTVDWRVYWRYYTAGAGKLLLFCFFLLMVGAQAMFAVTEWWLSQWATAEDQSLAAKNNTSQDDFIFEVYEEQLGYIKIYAILCGVTIAALFLRSFLTFIIFITAARVLHNRMFAAVIRAPMQFYDTNPVGRILNRFAKDTGYMDELLPPTLTDFLQITVFTISVVVVISIFNPFCLAFTLPLFLIFYCVRKFYLASSRSVKRLEGNARSPVFSHLSASLTGLSTVRAFKSQQRFINAFDEYQDRHTEAWFMFLATSRWFGVQLDFFSMMFICGVCFSSVLAADFLSLSSGVIGLSLTYAINLMGAFQWGVRQSAEVENQMTSVERVCQYIDIEPEAPLEMELKPPPEWPKYGLITLEGASLRYGEDGPQVIKRIYCSIRAKEKVGIVGRTGAGKSSLMTILMRLAEPTGTIKIDGIDIAKIGLHDLRKKVSFIPQDPVLFSGTLRRNLDPFNEHSDANIWRAIEEVELKPAVEELPEKLEAILTEGGTNFSVGQRQLLCLARAILRKNKILIVDEATANVDVRTDRLIQSTIRERFKHCTVLTIAHRLNTIMDSDRVLVLDAGRLVEFDEPYILLQKEDSLFTMMVQESGKAEEAKLVEVAKDKYNERNPSDPYGLSDPEKKHSLYASPGGRRTISIETSL